VDFVQIREKDLDDRSLYDLSVMAVRLAAGTPCRILVNGRADIAVAAGAHGVHLPAAGVPIERLRPWLPRPFIVGASVHSLAEAQRARRKGADYVLLGHVFPTASKAGYGLPLGVEVLRRVCHRAGIPVLALGGITLQNRDSALDAGAAGVAAISLFQSSLDFRVPAGPKSADR